MRLLTYIACPYSHERSDIRQFRFDTVTRATRHLMEEKRWNVFSPITHSHPLHEIGMAGDWNFWKKIDTQYLQLSCRLVVLAIPGWETSVGVQAEIKIAHRMGIKVFLLPCGVSKSRGLRDWKKFGSLKKYVSL